MHEVNTIWKGIGEDSVPKCHGLRLCGQMEVRTNLEMLHREERDPLLVKNSTHLPIRKDI